jgi:hypothetical protein
MPVSHSDFVRPASYAGANRERYITCDTAMSEGEAFTQLVLPKGHIPMLSDSHVDAIIHKLQGSKSDVEWARLLALRGAAARNTLELLQRVRMTITRAIRLTDELFSGSTRIYLTLTDRA